MDETESKKTLKNDEIVKSALKNIADNTMCTREAIGVAARIGETWIAYIGIIALAVTVLLMNPYDKTAPIICYGVIAVFGLYAIIHSLVLLSDLKHTVEDVSNSKKKPENTTKKPFWKYF